MDCEEKCKIKRVVALRVWVDGGLGKKSAKLRGLVH